MVFMKKNTNYMFLIFIIFILTSSIVASYALSSVWGQTYSNPLISTRGHYDLDTGQMLQGHNSTDYDASNIPNCPPEIGVFIHGWGLNEPMANERYNRTWMSLQANNYSLPLISFSWDSNTTSSLSDSGLSGWNHAKSIARDNGPKLAQFIIDYADKCNSENKESKIRLISHSLGARVILSSLDSLHKNDSWNNNNYTVTSVHLLGAAVDNEEVSKNILDITNDWTNLWTEKTIAYGNAIEQEVTDFYNLYSPNDNYLEPKALMQIYPSYEYGDWALGQNGYQILPYPITTSLPQNYKESNVENEIAPTCDADGDKNIDFTFSKGDIINRGDNHLGYIGSRNVTDNTKLIDDGAVNIVVDNWKNVKPEFDQGLALTARCN